MSNPLTKKMCNDLNKWLGDKLNDKYVENIYSDSFLPKSNFGSFHKDLFHKYYSVNDIDIDISTNNNQSQYFESENQDNDSITKYIETYDDRSVLLLPGSNQSHANYLFKKLIDASSEMIYEIPNLSMSGNYSTKRIPMIDKSFKNEFYKFCFMETSKKSI